jgi:hypothetical protein
MSTTRVAWRPPLLGTLASPGAPPESERLASVEGGPGRDPALRTSGYRQQDGAHRKRTYHPLEIGALDIVRQRWAMIVTT